MFEEKKMLRTGALVSALFVCALAFALSYDFKDLGPALRIKVYLAHPGPLRAPADLQLAGRKIGKVQAISLVTSHQAQSSSHPLHPDGGVVLDVLVQKKYAQWVRGNSQLIVNAKGLIGESYLEVTPPPGTEEMLAPVVQGQTIRGVDPARMEHIVVTSFENARRFGALMREMKPSLDLFRDESQALMATLASLEQEPGQWSDTQGHLQEIRSSIETLSPAMELTWENFPELAKQSRTLLQQAKMAFRSQDAQLARLMASVNATRASLPKGLPDKIALLSKTLKRSSQKIAHTISTAEELLQRIEEGRGTLGALINDPEFADDRKKIGRYIKRHAWEIMAKPPDKD